MKKDTTPQDELLFVALGGSGEIGMNANLYGCQGKWLMVDLGMTFSGTEYPGVDLVFPDLEFIEDRADDLLGVVLTHAHEDHIGALPYFARDLGVPLYATPFTADLIRRKLDEAGLTQEVDVVVIDETEGGFSIGPFDVTYVPMAHSIAEANALLIDTPHGFVFHSGDWKLDEDPIIGSPASEQDLQAIGDKGILALVCDSTNAFNPHASGSEGAVYQGLLDEVRLHAGKRVVVTTFASNVARLQTLGNVAMETGRRICVAGRSIDRILQVAQDNGYCSDFPDPIDFETAMELPRGEVLILATGGQGEPRAALSRMAQGNHPIALAAGDVVIFSSRQIPGNEVPIGAMQDALVARGIKLVTGRRNLVHVSGHPGRPELEALYAWLRPQILVPVHGEMRHMAEQAALAKASGIAHPIVQRNGDMIRLAPGRPEKLREVRAGRLLLDGDLLIPADGEAITMRRRLAHSGLVIVALDHRYRAMITSVGLPLDEDHAEFVEEAREAVHQAVAKASRKGGDNDRSVIHEAVRLAARRTALKWTGKKPQVTVMMADDAD